MSHPHFSSEEIRRRGREIYERIRRRVETDENIGKLVSIDIETGDYEIGDDASLEAPRRIRARHPDAAIYTARIGYDAAYAIGGVLERIGR
jgi:hypothetical protein